MNVWVCKPIDILKYKDTVIDSLIALKAALGEKLNERTIWVSDRWKDSISGSCFAPKNYIAYVSGGVCCRFPSVAHQAYIDLGECVTSNGEKYLCAYIDELRPEENERNTILIKCLESSAREIESRGDLFYVDIENRNIYSI